MCFLCIIRNKIILRNKILKKELEVYFVRHGQTLFNLSGRMQGWSDSPLTNAGLEVLEETGEKLKNIHFDAVYSSDLKRAVDTAEIVLKNNKETTNKIIPSTYFREVFFGSFEGMLEKDTWKIVGKPYGLSTVEEIRDTFSPDFLRDATKEADPYHLAENSSEVIKRLDVGYKQLLSENDDKERILVVTHGGIIKDIASRHGSKKIIEDIHFPSNGSYTIASIREDGIKIKKFNL